MTATTTDWITLGECEFREGSAEVSADAIRTALLPHQPRRCLQRPVVLCSNNGKSSRFVTPTGLSSMPHYILPELEKPSEPVNPCTDFVLSGLVAEGPSGASLDAIRAALLPADFPRTPVRLASNNAKASHWVSNGLCSTTFTNQDFLWMENAAKLDPGSLFKAFCDADNATTTEHSWDPMRRWNALARTLRTPRGSKSSEHLQNLRRSDPLIRLSAWHDWERMLEDSRRSRQARAHQLAVYERGLMCATRAAAETTAAAAEREREATHFLIPIAPPDNGLKRALHLGRLRAVDGAAPGHYASPAEDPDRVHQKPRPERFSNDSVMAWELGYAAAGDPGAAKALVSPTLRPAVRRSPALHGGAPPLPPIADLDGGVAPLTNAPAKAPADPSSPGSVMGLPLDALDEPSHAFSRYKLGDGIADAA